MGKRKAHVRREHDHNYWIGRLGSQERHLESRHIADTFIPESNVSESEQKPCINQYKKPEDIFIYVYEPDSASDYHDGIQNFHEFFSTLLNRHKENDYPMKYIYLETLEKSFFLLAYAMRHSNAVNDFREMPYLFYVPCRDMFESCSAPALCCLVKTDNNGTTRLYSTTMLKDFERDFVKSVKVSF